MTKRFHGITSIVLVAVAIVIAAIAVFRASWVMGVIYLALCVAASLTIIYAYCAKCTCKEHCAHVFLGKAAMTFDRQPGPYTATEITALVLALALLLGLPQFWLWRHTGLFVTFWALNAIAVIQIRIVVCPACDNAHCPLKPGQ
jgi:hypothetical protein